MRYIFFSVNSSFQIIVYNVAFLRTYRVNQKIWKTNVILLHYFAVILSGIIRILLIIVIIIIRIIINESLLSLYVCKVSIVVHILNHSSLSWCVWGGDWSLTNCKHGNPHKFIILDCDVVLISRLWYLRYSFFLYIHRHIYYESSHRAD